MDPRSTTDETPNPSEPLAELSEREREILILVATGASNKQIAQQLVISPNTVKVHLRNVFAKISVASRTEAALYAIRQGLVQVNGGVPVVAAEDNPLGPTEAELTTAAPPAEVAPVAVPVPTPRPRRWGVWLVAGIVVLALLATGLWAMVNNQPRPTAPAPTAVIATQPPRWTAQADLPTARAGLAVTTYENQIYAIGGETATGVTGVVELYNSANNTWRSLTPKPVAVADVEAAVIGGKIYVPGGRLASGAVTDVLEVYDPREDRWEKRAALPQPLSAYAVAAFEGRLFLFGGWDGEHYVNTALVYNPSDDTWSETAPMPTARGFAGAAVASGRIYVIGGTAGDGPLTVNEEYTPEADQPDNSPWQAAIPLPEGRARFGLACIADIIHIVGGNATPGAPPIKLTTAGTRWEAFDLPTPAFPDGWQGLGAAVVETKIYFLGGRTPAAPLTPNLSYQAIFSIQLP